jgi:hypothetical protein
MNDTASNPLPAASRTGRSGKRHWFQITGLPGWKRAQMGMPAFGNANCSTTPESLAADPKATSGNDNQGGNP